MSTDRLALLQSFESRKVCHCLHHDHRLRAAVPQGPGVSFVSSFDSCNTHRSNAVMTFVNFTTSFAEITYQEIRIQHSFVSHSSRVTSILPPCLTFKTPPGSWTWHILDPPSLAHECSPIQRAEWICNTCSSGSSLVLGSWFLQNSQTPTRRLTGTSSWVLEDWTCDTAHNMGSMLLVRIAGQGSLSRIHPKTPSLLYDTVRLRSSPFQTLITLEWF